MSRYTEHRLFRCLFKRPKIPATKCLMQISNDFWLSHMKLFDDPLNMCTKQSWIENNLAKNQTVWICWDVGNEIVDVMLSRLEGWKRVNRGKKMLCTKVVFIHFLFLIKTSFFSNFWRKTLLWNSFPISIQNMSPWHTTLGFPISLANAMVHSLWINKLWVRRG